MKHGFVKSIMLKLISKGIKIPGSFIDRFYELTYLKTLLQILDINCVLDVGANRGQFAHELRAIGYTGYIISFEPIKQEFEILSQSFSKDLKWRGYQIALGRKNESSKINIPDLTVMSSLLEPIGDQASLLKILENQRPAKYQTIDVKCLDSLYPSIIKDIVNPRVFLKMDTQGYDLEVFKGAKQCLEQIYGLESELSIQSLYKNMPHYYESLYIYEKAGFELYNLSVVNRIPTGGLLELNAFMRRPMECE